jgi:hypothetical protein
MACLTTYLDLASALKFEDPVQLQVESYISDKRSSKSQHLASYVSHHNAMANDMVTLFRGTGTNDGSGRASDNDNAGYDNAGLGG